MKLYPIEIQMKVKLTDGHRKGDATVGLGLFKLPTEDELDEAVRKAVEVVLRDNPSFRTMTREEIWDERIAERTGSGMLFATPNMNEGEEWWREESPKVLEEVRSARFARSSIDDEEDDR
jgi:hypothetical protein